MSRGEGKTPIHVKITLKGSWLRSIWEQNAIRSLLERGGKDKPSWEALFAAIASGRITFEQLRRSLRQSFGAAMGEKIYNDIKQAFEIWNKPPRGLHTPPVPPGTFQSLGNIPQHPLGLILQRGGMIPAWLHPGEGVLTPQGVAALGGPSVLRRLNAGIPLRRTMPERPININITIQAWDGVDVERVLMDKVIPELRRLSDAGVDVIWQRGVRNV